MNGQAGIEFLIYVSIALLIINIFLYSYYSKNYELVNVKLENELKEIASAAAFEINSAVKAGEGYERRFNMKDYYSTLKNFNITIIGNVIQVDFSGRYYYASVATNNIIGNFSLEWNVIKNKDGVIYVN